MTDLARYFERYRQSAISRVTRVTDVTGPPKHWDRMPFVSDGLSPGNDISRVTRVTEWTEAMPSQETGGVVTPVTSVAYTPGDHAGQQRFLLHQQVIEPITRVTHVTREIDRRRLETTDPTSCAHCGAGERSGAMIVPFGTESTGHTWLHSGCWRAWYAKRRGEDARADATAH